MSHSSKGEVTLRLQIGSVGVHNYRGTICTTEESGCSNEIQITVAGEISDTPTLGEARHAQWILDCKIRRRNNITPKGGRRPSTIKGPRRVSKWEASYEAKCAEGARDWDKIEELMDSGLTLKEAATKVGYTLDGAKSLRNLIEGSVI